jgi:lysophospholipase L1-like esterase
MSEPDQPRTVLCYGDSNTHGTVPMRQILERERFGPDARWPGVMAGALGPGWHVVEAGLPGRTTSLPDPVMGAHINGLAVLPAVLASAAPVDLVVLMLGTNDLKRRFQMPALEIAVCLENLLLAVGQSIAGPGGAAPRRLVVAPAPVTETGCLAEIFEGAERQAPKLAGHYAAVAERHGAEFFDAGGVVAVSPVDGVHLDAGAHAALGRALADAARATLD